MRYRLQWIFALLLLAGTAAAQSLPAGPVRCENGAAAGFACKDVDLLAFVPTAAMGGALQVGTGGAAELNDIWGWTDPETGREYALVGRSDGMAVVDVTRPTAPAFLGLLPRSAGSNASAWRDIKVYGHYALVVSEASNQGMQVFDLTTVRGLAPDASRLLAETARYDGISRAHNLVVDEETGFAFAVGSRAAMGGPACGFGLHIIDVRQPTAPTYAGCFNDPATGRGGNGYTHDAQCVVYRGPDARYAGREICLAANENALSIADVTDKGAPTGIATFSYPAAAYTHQGWLSEDQRYFFLDDELDERNGFVARTRTLVIDLLRLDSPVLLDAHLGEVSSIDHNQYVRGHYSFQANYTSGLRILDVSDPANLREVAFFDTYPAADSPTDFLGLWSVYPFFASGTVVVSDIGQGLFVLRPAVLALGGPSGETPQAFSFRLGRSGDGVVLTLGLPQAQPVRVAVYDALGRRVALVADGVFEAGQHPLAFAPDGLAGGVYFVRAWGAGQSQTRPFVHAR